MIRRLMLSVAAAFLAVATFAPLAYSQVPSTNPPYNTDMGALITNTARVAGTVTSAQQTNLANLGVVCTLNQTAVSGSPSTAISLQGYDAASNSYETYSTVTILASSINVPTSIMVYPGAVATAVPSGMTVVGLHLPLKWRISQTIAGTSGPAPTSTVGCGYLR